MAGIANRYPLWRYIFIIVVIIAAFIYAAPNLFPDYYAVQIMGANAALVDNKVIETSETALQKSDIPYHDVVFQNQTLVFRFTSTDDQLKAKEVIQTALG